MLKTLRDIRETIGGFISIIVVIFIGCFFFAGIIAATTGVSKQIEDYNAELNTASARATYLYVNSAAIDDIKTQDWAKKDGVKVEGFNTFYSKIKGTHTDVTLTTLTPGVDDLNIVKGKLPSLGKKEILIDEIYSDAHNLNVGDDITLTVDTLQSIDLTISDLNDLASIDGKIENVPIDYTFTVSGIFHSVDTMYKVDYMNATTPKKDFIMAAVNYDEVGLFTLGDDGKVNAAVNVTMQGRTYTPLKFSTVTDNVKVYNGIRVLGDAPDFEKVFKKYTIDFESDAGQNYLVKLLNPLSDEERQKQIISMPAGYFVTHMVEADYPSIKAYSDINGTLQSLAAVLPILFFAVAAAITVISMTKTVEGQRNQIGIIQAIGVNKGNIYFSYIFYALFASLIGSILGGVVGMFTIPYMLLFIYSVQFAMPIRPLFINPLWMILGVVIAAALACLSAFISCHNTLKIAPAQAMRPKPPKKTKKIFIERFPKLWKKIGFSAKMNLRNMFLHKLRMLLSSVGIIGCLALMIGLIGMKDNMVLSQNHYAARNDYDIEVLTDAVDVNGAYKMLIDAQKRYPQLTQKEVFDKLTLIPTISAHFEFNGKKEDITLAAIPTVSDAQKVKEALEKETDSDGKPCEGVTYDLVNPDCIELYRDTHAKTRVAFNDDTLVLPQNMAKKLNVKAGDEVKITGTALDGQNGKNGSSFNVTVKVTDVVPEYFTQSAYCSYGFYQNNGIPLYADTIYVNTPAGADAKICADKIIESGRSQDVLKIRGAQTFADKMGTLVDGMVILDYAVILFVIGAMVLCVAVIYNITSTNLKDRTREIATLMVLGYKKNEVGNMLIIENMVITALGCLIGTPISYFVLMWLVSIAGKFGVIISGIMSWYIVLLCIAGTFVFSLFATWLLNGKIKKISMVEALKSVE